MEGSHVIGYIYQCGGGVRSPEWGPWRCRRFPPCRGKLCFASSMPPKSDAAVHLCVSHVPPHAPPRPSGAGAFTPTATATRAAGMRACPRAPGPCCTRVASGTLVHGSAAGPSVKCGVCAGVSSVESVGSLTTVKNKDVQKGGGGSSVMLPQPVNAATPSTPINPASAAAGVTARLRCL